MANIDDLKKILTDLRATGDDGFEGLIGTVLSEIADVPLNHVKNGVVGYFQNIGKFCTK